MAGGGDGYDMLTKAKRIDGAGNDRLLTQILADYLSAKGKIAQAIMDFSRAIEIDPTNVSAYNNRGLAYRSMGMIERVELTRR